MELSLLAGTDLMVRPWAEPVAWPGGAFGLFWALGSTSHADMEAARRSLLPRAGHFPSVLLQGGISPGEVAPAGSVSACSTAALCNPAWEQQNFLETVCRHKSAGGYWSTQDLHHWATWSPPQEQQHAKDEQNSVVKLPLPSADNMNPLGVCQ